METNRGIRMAAAVCTLIAGLCAVATGKIIYVDDDAVGANDGSSWANAFPEFRDALGVAVEGDEIHVAQGTYRPDQGAGIKRGSRQATFSVVDGTILRGGYAGIGATDPNSRNVELYETTLTGDLSGDDPDVQAAHTLVNAGGRADNSLNVVTIRRVDFCVLDGFIIRAGHAPHGGGGLRIEDSRAIIWNCTFTRNWAGGGGAICILGGHPEIHHCRFRVNAAPGGGGLYVEKGELLLTACEFAANTADRGGGIDSMGADLSLSGCTFKENSAANGAGLSHSAGNIQVTGCTFIRNIALPTASSASSKSRGGAMMVWTPPGRQALVTDCLFRGNEASDGGAIDGIVTAVRGCRFTGNIARDTAGAIDHQGSLTCENCLFDGNRGIKHIAALRNYGGLVLTNCTFIANRSDGGYTFQAYGGHGSSVAIVLTNCIVWDEPHNLDPKHMWLSKASVTYSDVQGGYPGTGNIDTDPHFADAGYWDPNSTPADLSDGFWVEGDYHLKSRAGRWDPVTQAWVQDEVTSPCIDTGDPNSLVADEPEPNGGRINMGAYGGTAEASKAYFNKP